MGKEYRNKFKDEGVSKTTPEMRVLCNRPGKLDKDGNILYTTEQSSKKMTDINHIIKKYDKTGLIDHVSRFEARFGDMTGLDFKLALDKITHAQSMFENLPSEIRKKFQNNPQKLLEFMEDPGNRDEAIKLGMIRAQWTPGTDGLGEHVQEDEHVNENLPETQ